MFIAAGNPLLDQRKEKTVDEWEEYTSDSLVSDFGASPWIARASEFKPSCLGVLKVILCSLVNHTGKSYNTKVIC